MKTNNKGQRKNVHQRKPIIGWVSEGKGWYFAPEDFAQNTSFLTKEFEEFAKKSRSRWDIFEYIKTLLENR